MKIKFYLLFFLSSCSLVHGQQSEACIWEPKTTIVHGNDIRAKIGNIGVDFFDNGESSFDAQFGQPDVFFNNLESFQGLWIAGVDPGGNLKVAGSDLGIASGRVDFWPGPIVDGTTHLAACNAWNRFWTVRRHDIEAHIADYEDDGVISYRRPSIFGWPGAGNIYFVIQNGLLLPDSPQGWAPFFDRNNDGIYDPLNGDYPLPENVDIIPEQIIWSVFNDEGGGSIHGTTNGLPIRVEVHQTVWTFSCVEDSPLNQTLFFSKKFINRAAEDVKNTFVGFLNDFGIGCGLDDGIGSSDALETVFFYNLNNSDGETISFCNDLSSDEDNPPVIAFTFLNTELDFSLPLNHSTDCSSMPIDAQGYYDRLTGYTTRDRLLTFGEDGCNPDNPPTNLVFPDDPNDPNGWSMITNGGPAAENFDLRNIMSTKLNNLSPEEFAVVDYAVSFHQKPGNTNLENVSLMYDQVLKLRNAYDANFSNVCQQPVCEDDCIWPGDANRDDIANHCDLLDVALQSSKAGPNRDYSLVWQPTDGDNWSGNSTSGVNLKHADCDGSGEIEAEDFNITVANYDLTTPAYIPPEDVYQDGQEISVTHAFNGTFENVPQNEELVLRIRLDNLPDIFGVAFQMEFDSRYFTDNGVGEENRYLLNPGFYQFSGGRKKSGTLITVDYAFTRSHLDSVLQDGNYYLFRLTVRPFFNQTFPSNFTEIKFKNIKAVRGDGTEVEIGSKTQLITFAGITTNFKDKINEDEINIFPNPTSQIINIVSEKNKMSGIKMYDSLGKLILQEKINNNYFEKNIANLSKGIYWVRIQFGEQFLFKKIIVN
ncbi:MAG: T9SS type A sorting domain-containing protein [Bacteroidota bacterium]